MNSRALLFLAIIFTPVSFAETTQKDVRLDDINVVASTPLHGVGLDKGKLPYSVQTANADDIKQTQSLDVSCLLYTSPSPRDS